jgi:hypothetical protein
MVVTLPTLKDALPRIAGNKSPVKIIAKAKNDKRFIRPWVEHHAKIVGAENLIVADNSSDDAEYLRELEDSMSKGTLFSFTGFHNRLHSRKSFKSLFEAIAESTKYIIVLDLDERLYWTDGVQHVADTRISDFLISEDLNAYPSLLIDNAPGAANTLSLPERNNHNILPLTWGKPFVRATIVDIPDNPDTPIHNCQFPKSLFSEHHRTHLVLAHLLNLDPEQRIAANMEKLRARGMMLSESDLELTQVRELRTHFDPVIARCAHEIETILVSRASGRPISRNNNAEIALKEDGCIEYGSESVEMRFAQLREMKV